MLAYDLRGRGGSDKPAKDYNLAAHNRDLLGLLDHLGRERPVIMGHSLGAHIAVRFAAHYPDRVAKLVLFDGGLDVRAEVLDSLGPSIGRLVVVPHPQARARERRASGRSVASTCSRNVRVLT